MQKNLDKEKSTVQQDGEMKRHFKTFADNCC